MNDETVDLLFDVVARLERNIQERECPAIVALDGERKLVLTDYDYLRDDATAEAFERRAAAKAQEIAATRWVLAVPQVWLITSDRIATRAVANLPLREGEEEAITWTAFDRHDGVDYGRVPFTRRPNGEPVFDDPEEFTDPLRPAATTPGYVLLQVLIGDDNATTGGRHIHRFGFAPTVPLPSGSAEPRAAGRQFIE